MEAVLTLDKQRTLIHELLVAEAWADRVQPHIFHHIAQNNPLRAYFAVRAGCPLALWPCCRHLRRTHTHTLGTPLHSFTKKAS